MLEGVDVDATVLSFNVCLSKTYTDFFPYEEKNIFLKGGLTTSHKP